jgi:hypothetical protein
MPITLDGTNGITTPTYGGTDTAEYLVPVTQFKNRIINGAMTIDQRNAGASVTQTSSYPYSVDRWQIGGTVSSKFTAQQNAGSVTPPAGFSNYLGITSSSAYSVPAGDIYLLQQSLEGFNTYDLDWGTANAKTVTLSFWVRSSLTGAFGGAINNFANNRSYPFSYTISASNTWEYKTITVTGDTGGTWVGSSNAGSLTVRFGLGVGSTFSGTAGAWAAGSFYAPTGSVSVVGTNGATFYITGVQLEKGTTATSFDYRPYGTELQLCQRYFERWTTADQNMVGFCYASNNLNTYSQFLVEKRAAPTLTRYGTFTAFVNGSGNTITFASYYAATKAININWTGGGISAGQAFAWGSSGSPNQFEFSAEL